MDFIEGLPKSGGYDSILVVVDRLSKYVHFLALKHPFSAKDVSAVFLNQVVKLHGFPKSIVSDRDRVFLSHFWTELFRLQQTVLTRSSAYHPQTDGQSEVVNRCLETYLRCFAHQQPKQWSKWLAWAEYFFNTTFHTSTRMTPFKIMYGRDPPPLLPYSSQSTSNSTLEDQLLARDLMLSELREQLLRAQSRMKEAADRHCRDVEFKEGDLVYLKLRPYRQQSLAARPNEKLSPRYFGPYPVLKRIGKVAYRLELPPEAKIHPVFHVSQLKQALGSSVEVQPFPLVLSPDMEWMVEPEDVLATRITSEGTELLIKWKDLPECEATWEPLDLICSQFPHAHLGDKVNVQRGGIDGSAGKPPIKFHYERRKKRGFARAGAIN